MVAVDQDDCEERFKGKVLVNGDQNDSAVCGTKKAVRSLTIRVYFN